MHVQISSQNKIASTTTMQGQGGTKLTNKVALIVGVTGLVGKELAMNLAARPEWKVYGVARGSPEVGGAKCNFISCDLTDPSETMQKLSLLVDVTHVFWVTWGSQFPLGSRECLDQNKAMMSNALNAIIPRAKGLQHVSLQTGTKHYLPSIVEEDDIDRGGSSSSSSSSRSVAVYDEDSPRFLPGYNFYYSLEDLLTERLGSCKVGWSVHRPGLLLGSSRRTAFNFTGSLCVYAAICRHLDLPFFFGGSRMCWEEAYIDASDARLVAQQHIWASTHQGVMHASGEAFNSLNGSSFTWKEMWPALAAKFQAKVVPEPDDDMFRPGLVFSATMHDKGAVWEEIVEKEGLRKTKMEELANWWFLDAVFRCPVKILCSRKKAESRGFTMGFGALESILYWVDCMKKDRLIP
ncbi:hypothetical protein ACLOJK_012367 [Asimina triloba]